MNTAVTRICKQKGAIGESRLIVFSLAVTKARSPAHLHHTLDFRISWHTNIHVPHVDEVAGSAQVLGHILRSDFWTMELGLLTFF
jgi:hypothetical protein